MWKRDLADRSRVPSERGNGHRACPPEVTKGNREIVAPADSPWGTQRTLCGSEVPGVGCANHKQEKSRDRGVGAVSFDFG